jgi:calcineurin-like phosphoesterase family protein
MIYVVSDRHFRHRKICEYTGRPYDTVDDMDNDLIRRHNNVVKPEDIFIDMGDFGWGAVVDQSEILSKLNGRKKILIRGNHDRGTQAMFDMGWDAVFDEAIFCYLGYKVLMQHKPYHGSRPVDQETGRHKFDFVFHGHIHNSNPSDLVEAGEPVSRPLFNLNLSVEVINYAPVSFKHAIRMAKGQLDTRKLMG